MKSISFTVSLGKSWAFGAPVVSKPFIWENLTRFYSRTLPSFLDFSYVTVRNAQFLTGAIVLGVFFGIPSQILIAFERKEV